MIIVLDLSNRNQGWRLGKLASDWLLLRLQDAQGHQIRFQQVRSIVPRGLQRDVVYLC
jgi:hypothetical protein